MINLKHLSDAELTQYLANHRNDEEAFSEALQELINRNQDIEWYSNDLSSEAVEAILEKNKAIFVNLTSKK